MSELTELLAQHRGLEERAERLMRIVNLPVPDPAAVAGERWRMAQMLLDHCAAEDRIVYDTLLASGDSGAMADAQAAQREYGALGSIFTQYITDWPISRIGREWIGFRLATGKIFTALAARMEREEQILYPQFERVTRRRAA